jgi:hypothetical protein
VTAAAVAAAFVFAGVVTAAPSSAATTRYVSAGASWSSALSASSPGDTIVLRTGTHPYQLIMDRYFGGVTIRGESRTGTIINGLYLKNTQGLTFTNLTVSPTGSYGYSAIRVTDNSNAITFDTVRAIPLNTPTGRSGFDIFSNSGSSRPPHDIKVINSVYNGSQTTGTSARGVRLWAGNSAASTWPYNILIDNNDLAYAPADIIQIGGARNVTISRNRIHDVQENSDHNDGIQSYGSDHLVITRNRFWAPGVQGGPDQAIMLSNAPSTAPLLKVTNTTVENNLIVKWRGNGMTISGTNVTWIMNNTSVGNGGASLAVGTTYGPNYTTRVFNNIMDRIYPSTGAGLWYEDFNMVKSGGHGRYDDTSDPKFVDTTNYALQSTSPAIDTAQLNGAPPVDYAGLLRAPDPDKGARELP